RRRGRHARDRDTPLRRRQDAAPSRMSGSRRARRLVRRCPRTLEASGLGVPETPRDLARGALPGKNGAVDVAHVAVRRVLAGEEDVPFRHAFDAGELRVLSDFIIRVRTVVPPVVRPHVEVRGAGILRRNTGIHAVEFAYVSVCNRSRRRAVGGGRQYPPPAAGETDEY